MRKYFYVIPVHISTSENPLLNIEKKVRTSALNKRQAIAIAKKEAEKYFLSRFPTYSLKNVNLDIVKDKIEIKGSKEINNKPKKRYKKKPLLPFDKNRIRCLPDESYKVGDQVVTHKIIIFDNWLKMKLLKDERPLIKNNTLVIKGPDYVKVLTRNQEDMPIFLRFELDKEKGIDSMVEFIQGFGYNSWVPKNLFNSALRIAKDYLEVKNEKKS